MNRKIIDHITVASIPIAITILAAYIYFVSVLSDHPVLCPNAIRSSLLAPYIIDFQELFPVLSIVLSIVFFGLGALLTIMMITRYNLLGESSQLPILFYVCFCIGFATSPDLLAPVFAACIMALSMRDLFRTYDNNGSTSKLLSGCFWMGILPLIYPSTIVLWLAPFIFLIFFVKSLREIGVVFVGLLIPIFIYSYIQWLMGEAFITPTMQMIDMITTKHCYPPHFVRPLLLCRNIFASVTALLVFISMLQIDRISLRFVSRTRLYCTFTMVFLSVIMVFIPSHSYQVTTTLAAPLAIAVTPAFMRLRSWITIPLFLAIIVLSLSVLLVHFSGRL